MTFLQKKRKGGFTVGLHVNRLCHSGLVGKWIRLYVFAVADDDCHQQLEGRAENRGHWTETTQQR